jgi:hypothetical protein
MNARVQKHREKLIEQHRQRLEVCIDCALIDKMYRIARFKHEPMWSAVQAALEDYVEECDKLIAEQRRLNDERTRILGQADSLGCRRQIEEYNRQLVTFHERLTTFQRSRYVVSGQALPAEGNQSMTMG